MAIRRIPALIFGWLLVCPFLPALAASPASEQLAVTGTVEHPLTLDVPALQALPATTLGETPMRCGPTTVKYVSQSYQGVLLTEVLTRAGVKLSDHHANNRIYVVATATDGYPVVFSWHELFNTPIGEGVLVFYARDGKPLTAEDGLIGLISARDTYPCGRHVKWLNHLDVRVLPVSGGPD